MDLPDNWEKIALVVVGIVFILTVIYALNPFYTTSNDTNQESGNQDIVPVPFPKTDTNNDSGNSSINITTNITAEQAKNIATQANPGYTAGEPISDSVVVNGTNYTVWKVPLSKPNSSSKTIYIDIQTGLIVLES